MGSILFPAFHIYTHSPPISSDDKQKPKLTIIIKLQMKFLSMAAKKRNNDTATNMQC
jgi:hypothetical protein